MHRTAFSLILFLFSTVLFASGYAGHPATGGQTGAGMGSHLSSPDKTLPNKGEVLEVLGSGLYVYLQVEDKGEILWLAVSKMEVKKGDMVRYSKGNLMEQFYSKKLSRTFDKILFVESAAVVEAAHPTITETKEILGISGTADALPNLGRVISTVDSGGYTYIEVDQEGVTRWLAAPQVSLDEGAMIRYGDGAVMANFYSKKLDREFEEVTFLGSVQIVDK